MRLPSWLDLFIRSMEVKSEERAEASSVPPELICFESVEKPGVGIREYVALLWGHWSGVKTWAATMLYMERLSRCGMDLNELTIHRVVLSCLAVAAHKSSCEGVSVADVSGPGGVDKYDLSAMVKALAQAVGFDFSFTVSELGERIHALDSAYPLTVDNSRNIAFAAQLLTHEKPESPTVDRWLEHLETSSASSSSCLSDSYNKIECESGSKRTSLGGKLKSKFKHYCRRMKI
eukprot:TRINITY_DN330_c0_g6_i1.p1 TRINITY_DN330_c0_g6~~TRINITY_DN330_c0_g6_i1.p1  ORF type:complete len:255 (+),score=37.71 TRINITY_DN330_c0_g6_i1:68-766(+)